MENLGDGDSRKKTDMMTFVDAGGRYGPQKSERMLLSKGLATVYAFEPDPEEYNYLHKTYAGLSGYYVYNYGLGEKDGTCILNLTEHRGQCSVFEPDMESQWFGYCRPNDGVVSKQIKIQVRRLDGWLKSLTKIQPIPNFLKSDTEGSELSIFKGAGQMLETFFGICTEVHFAPVYRSAPTFSDIHHFLLSRDYKLLNLSYDGRGNPHSFFTPDHQRYGSICGVDAVYLRSEDFIRSAPAEDVIKIVLYMLINNAADYAFSVLSYRKDAIHSHLGTKIANEIEIMILRGIKMLQNTPTTQFKDGCRMYEEIFCKDFPVMHKFYPALRSLEDDG